jgi:hypothetical protein
MTKLEQQYRNNIGKLFVLKEKYWNRVKARWEDVDDLVLVRNIEKQGGWFHYHSDIIKHNIHSIPEVHNTSAIRVISCREFHRKCRSPLSLLGDTEKKEVA